MKRIQYTLEQKEIMARQALTSLMGLGFEAPSYPNFMRGAVCALYKPNGTHPRTPDYLIVERVLKEIKKELTKENKLELIIDMVQAGISPEKIVIAIKELLL